MNTPPDLEGRGRTIWDAFDAPSLPAGHRTLVHEIARTADLLDRLSALAMGRRENWAHLVFAELGEVTLSVDNLLSELRQQQANLQRLLGEARQAGLKQTGGRSKDEKKDGPGATILQLRNRLG
jgi:hypothetical protein